MPEIIGSKPPSRRVSGYKETVVTWLNPNCQLISNCDVPITDDISKAIKLAEELEHAAAVNRLVDDIVKKTPPMQQHQRAQ